VYCGSGLSACSGTLLAWTYRREHTMATMAELVRFPDSSPPPWREWTVEDLESLPDDGRRYELIDGVLLVHPVRLCPAELAEG